MIKQLLTPFLLFISFVSFAQIDCDPTKFYGLTTTGVVIEISLEGGGVVLGDTVTSPGIGLRGLAIADLGDGNKFYATAEGDTFYEYDGSSWSQVGSYTGYIMNGAGQGDHLYVQYIGDPTFEGDNSEVYRFEDGEFTIAWSNNEEFIGVSDLATDEDGNIYLFSGISQSDNSYILVLSPVGDELMTVMLPEVVSGFNLYGMFIAGNTIYMGIGPSNPTNANTLLPVHVEDGMATFGAFIPMPAGITFSDFASCSATNIDIVAIEEVSDASGVRVYPNPVDDQLFLQTKSAAPFSYSITDLSGELILSGKCGSSSINVPTQALAPGFYVVSLTQNNTTITRKIVVI